MQYDKVYILSVPGTALNSQNIPAETVNFGFNQGQRVQIKFKFDEERNIMKIIANIGKGGPLSLTCDQRTNY